MLSFLFVASLAVAGVAFVMVGVPVILFVWSRAISSGWHCGSTCSRMKEFDHVKTAARKEEARRN
jgi:hypothetical protein